MRILITGTNPVQCGHTPKLNYISSIRAVRVILDRLAHLSDGTSIEYEVRPVIPGEDLSGFDKAIIYMAPIRGWLCRHTLGTLWAMMHFGNKAILSYDDWQVREVKASIEGVAKKLDTDFMANKFNYANHAEATPHLDNMARLLEQLARPEPWQYDAIVPCYSGGKLEKLCLPMDLTRVTTYNPVLIFRGCYGGVQSQDNKVNRWILAALHNHKSWLKKQKLTWEVRQFGARSQGQKRLPEPQLFQEYVAAAGTLSPAYYTCGSGWWRARHGFAADALCVLAADPEELSMVSPDNLYSLRPIDVEALTDAEVKELAVEQAKDFYAAAPDLDQLALTFRQVLSR